MSHKLASALACLALGAAPAAAQSFSPTGGGAIDFTADTTEFASDANRLRLRGDVLVTQGDAALRADRIDVHFAPAVDGEARKVERIVATGSVLYRNPLETARADAGVYTVADDTIRLTGHVRLVRGRETLCGHELIMQVERRQIHARGGGGDDTACRGRVRAVIASSSTPDGLVLGGQTE